MPLAKITDVYANSIIKGAEKARHEMELNELPAAAIEVFDSSEIATDEISLELFLDDIETKGISFFIGPLLRSEVQVLQNIKDRIFLSGLALNNLEEIYPPSDQVHNVDFLSISALDSLQFFLNQAQNKKELKTLIFLPDYYRYEYVNTITDLSSRNISVWFYQEKEDNFNKLIKYALHSDVSMSRLSLLKRNTGNYSIISKPRRRQDIGSVYLLGNEQQIGNIIEFLKYYYIDTVPIVIALPSLRNKHATKKQFLGKYTFSSAWERTAMQSKELKNLNYYLFGYGYDSYNIAIKLADKDYSNYSGKLGVYTYNIDLRRFIVSKDLTRIGRKENYKISSAEFMQKIENSKNAVYNKRSKIKAK